MTIEELMTLAVTGKTVVSCNIGEEIELVMSSGWKLVLRGDFSVNGAVRGAAITVKDDRITFDGGDDA